MKSLSSLLSKRKQKVRPALTDKDIFYVFKKIIREEFGRIGEEKFNPDFFKSAALFVKSESSAWAGELFANRNKIIQKMNKELGKGIIKEIKIK